MREYGRPGGLDGELTAHIECKETAKTSGGQLELIYVVRCRREGRGIATEAVQSWMWWPPSSPSMKPPGASSQQASFAQDAAAEIGHGERWILDGQRVAPANP